MEGLKREEGAESFGITKKFKWWIICKNLELALIRNYNYLKTTYHLKPLGLVSFKDCPIRKAGIFYYLFIYFI